MLSNSASIQEQIEEKIRDMHNPRNDGYVTAGIKKELEELASLLNKELFKSNNTPTDILK